MRKGIRDPEYWRCEASFWGFRCQSGAGPTMRTRIASSDYWKCEAELTRVDWERQRGQPGNLERARIDNREYWGCENAIHNDILNSRATPGFESDIETTELQTPGSSKRVPLPLPDKGVDPSNVAVVPRTKTLSTDSSLPRASGTETPNLNLVGDSSAHVRPNFKAKGCKRRYMSIVEHARNGCHDPRTDLSSEEDRRLRKKRRLKERP